MNTTATQIVTQAHVRQFEENGYFILEKVIPDDHLEILRDSVQYFMDKIHAEMDKTGTDVLGITHRNKRYFISNRYKESPPMKEFLFSELMAEICHSTLGPEAFLFNEQYVLKCAEVGMKFGWHQDSGYIGYSHKPYLSCWCALDDVNVENGTVSMLPYQRAQTRKIENHTKEEGTNDLVGYHGDDPGEAVIVPAGSIAVFSSVCFHRSGSNTTNKMRRVYLAQYSSEPILTKDGTKVRGLADPFLHHGSIVAQ